MNENETKKGAEIKKAEKDKKEGKIKIEDNKTKTRNTNEKRKIKNKPLKSNYIEEMQKIIYHNLDETDDPDGIPNIDFEYMLKEINQLQLNEIKNHHETIKNFFIFSIKNGQRINQNTKDYIHNIDPNIYELINDLTDTIKNTIKDAENQIRKEQEKGTQKPKVYFKDPLKTEIYNIFLEAFKEFYKQT